MNREYSLADLIKRPELSLSDLYAATGDLPVDIQVGEQLEIAAKYSGYIDRQKEDINKLRDNEETALPEGFDFSRVNGLSNEVKEKLQRASPETLGRAARVPGVTPAAISLLLIYLKKTGLLTRSSAKVAAQ